MRWYVNQNGETRGPFAAERIEMLASWGKISRDAYICDEQFSTWVSITRSAFAPLVVGSTADAEAENERDSGEATAPSSKRSSHQLRAWLTGAVLLASALVVAISAM